MSLTMAKLKRVGRHKFGRLASWPLGLLRRSSFAQDETGFTAKDRAKSNGSTQVRSQPSDPGIPARNVNGVTELRMHTGADQDRCDKSIQTDVAQLLSQDRVRLQNRPIGKRQTYNLLFECFKSKHINVCF